MSQKRISNDGRKEALRRLRQPRGWTLWLVPKPLDLVTSLLYLSIPTLFFYSSFTDVKRAFSLPLGSEAHSIVTTCSCSFPWLQESLITSMMLALLAIDRLEYWFYGESTPTKIAVVLFIARLVCIESTAQLDHFRFSPFLYLVVPFIATLYFGDLIGFCLTSLAWIVYPIKHTLQNPDWYKQATEIQYFFVFTLGMAFALTMTRVVVRERASKARAEHLLAELKVTHQQLKAYAEQVEELAAAKERNRLARDIHDSLGHYLTVINVQLEKALAFRARKPQEADQAISHAKGLASEALQDVRRSVSELRASPDDFSVQVAITTLVQRMQSNQLSIHLQCEGSEEGFASEGLIALYRAAQEGLTNMQKRAGATHARVVLRFDEQQATLLLSDDGRGFDPALLDHLAPGREGRYGLQGVRERLELAGGSLCIESSPGSGTHLLASIPRQVGLRLEQTRMQTETML